jgi:hypothetical protein
VQRKKVYEIYHAKKKLNYVPYNAKISHAKSSITGTFETPVKK